MDILLKPIEDDIRGFKWFISDLEINTSEMEKLPINHAKDWFLITENEMNTIRKMDTQIVWGVISGISKKTELSTELIELPYAEGNEEIWKNGNLQIENSEIEIIAWDSSYTIVKFTKKEMSDKFKEYFDEAIGLENYNPKK